MIQKKISIIKDHGLDKKFLVPLEDKKNEEDGEGVDYLNYKNYKLFAFDLKKVDPNSE